MIQAIRYLKKSKFIKMSIFMFVFSFCAYSQTPQDSIFIIRKNNIVGTGRGLEIDSVTYDSLLSYIRMKKVSYVCIEPDNRVAKLLPDCSSHGHIYPVCSYPYRRDSPILTFRLHWMNDVELSDMGENQSLPSKETVGPYLQPATINIQEDDIASYFTKDSIVRLRAMSESDHKFTYSEYNVTYTYFKIKEEAKKKYEDVNFCNYLNVVIMGDTFSIVTYLKHKIWPQQKAIRHGTQIIGKNDCIETMKVKERNYSTPQYLGNSTLTLGSEFKGTEANNRFILIPNGAVISSFPVVANNIEYTIGVRNNKIIYIDTKDENFRINDLRINDFLPESYFNREWGYIPGWGKYVEIESGWYAGFDFRIIPDEYSRIQWFFKFDFNE